jgi:UDP-N-acetylglucosamine 3-dehydrogenase
VLTSLGAAVWVADSSAARLQWAVDHGVDPTRAVSDYRLALPHVDAVDVVTPADSHLEIASASLAAGRHCFVEKPLATTLEESRRLVAAAEASGRVVQVGHVFRFHPVTSAVRAALDADRLGRLRYATGRFCGLKRPRPDVGVTQTDAIHYFDLFAFLFAAEATSASAVQRDFLGRGLDDMSVTTVTYGDIPVVVEASYFLPGTYRECVIVGERGAVVADFGASTVRLYSGGHVRRGGAWEAVDTGKEDLPVSRDEPLRLELEAFVAACEGRGCPVVDARAGLRAVEVVEAAARSARLGRVVSIAELRAAA